MEEICGHVNKDELTANTRIARRHEPGGEKPGPRRVNPGGTLRLRNPIPRRRKKKISRRPSYVYHELEHRLIEDKDDHQPPRTTTASGTLPWMSRLKKVSPWGIHAKGTFLGSVPGSHGSTVATLSGLQLATLSSVPVSTLMPSGSGATVGPARVGLSALSNHWIPKVFGKVWGYLRSDS